MKQESKIIWAFKNLYDDDFIDTVENYIFPYIYNINHSIDNIVLINCQNMPAIFLRKMIASPTFMNSIFSNKDEYMNYLGNIELLINNRTIFLFFDIYSESGIPNDYAYNETSREVVQLHTDFTNIQFFITLMKNYNIAEYFKLPDISYNIDKHEYILSFSDSIISSIKRIISNITDGDDWSTLLIIDDIRTDISRVFDLSQSILGRNWEGKQIPEIRSKSIIPNETGIPIYPFRNLEYEILLQIYKITSDSQASKGLESFLRLLSICDKIGKRAFAPNVTRLWQALWYRSAAKDIVRYIASEERPPDARKFYETLGARDGLKAAVALVARNKSLTGEDKKNAEAAMAAANAAIRRIELCRDAARWISRGVMPWMRSLAANGRPLRILMIDNSVLNDENKDAMLRTILLPMMRIFLEANPQVTLDILPSSTSLRPDKGTYRDHVTYSLSDRDDYIHNVGPLFCLIPEERVMTKCDIFDYDLITVETDYRDHHVGPRIIGWLSTYIDRRLDRDNELGVKRGSNYLKGGPAILAMSRDEQFGNVHECLNLGAHSYVSKERIFQFPGRMRRAYEARLHRMEHPGQRSNFRKLYQLMPDRRAQLASPAAHDRVRGHSHVAKANPHANLLPFDQVELDWIRQIPKADLHCHMGTSIPFQAIRAMAFNSCGYLLHEGEKADWETRLTIKMIKEIDDLLFAASTGTEETCQGKMRSAAIARWNKPAEKAFNEKFGGVGDVIVNLLYDPANHFQKFQIMSLLVAIIEFRSFNFNKVEIDEFYTWEQYYRKAALKSADFLNSSKRNIDKIGIRSFGNRLWLEFAKIAHQGNWQGVLSSNEMKGNILVDSKRRWPLGHLATRISARSRRAYDLIKRALGDGEIEEISRWKNVLPIKLEDLVRLPKPDSPDIDRSLSAYLAGCDFLGSDHLQYPENLIIAAHAMVQANARDGIIYSEVRAEFTGYTKAGMNAQDATNLLCCAFDFATQVVKQEKINLGAGNLLAPYVRINVIVAAKRHKDLPDAERAVNLARHFLGRAPQILPLELRKLVPAWWQGSRVVGFDLSGDEQRNPEEILKKVKSLDDISAPITIHAGEAASADSIWSAVHDYSARRIGHGLKLRDKRTLMNYCISEEICMEMCPISNCYTGNFDEIEDPLDYDHTNPCHYPLRYYLETGLSVCLNTDNRFLHPRHYDTLSAEYMWAARLSGGLTKWEVLKLIKAGFRNSFLAKEEIAIFLDAVEDRVFSVLEI